MRPVGWGGVRGMGLGGLLLPFIHCQLSVVVNFSFSYNTYFLSSLGFMAAQYTPSGVGCLQNKDLRPKTLKRRPQNED